MTAPGATLRPADTPRPTRRPPTDDDRCGTSAGWYRHYRSAEKACDPCAAARRPNGRDYMRKVRARAGDLPPCESCGGRRKHGSGAFGWCESCRVRWVNAGRPDAGPPPPKRDPDGHYAEFTWLRTGGENVENAAQRVGVSVRHAKRYEARRREQLVA